MKKMTRTDDPRLKGRWPEFSRMSNRPGVGHSAMWEIASTILQYNLQDKEADVPSALRIGKKLMPLGPYLRRSLRLMIGRDPKAPQEILDQLSAEMLPLRQAAKSSSENPSLKTQITLANKGSRARIEARSKIFKQRKSL